MDLESECRNTSTTCYKQSQSWSQDGLLLLLHQDRHWEWPFPGIWDLIFKGTSVRNLTLFLVRVAVTVVAVENLLLSFTSKTGVL